MADALSEDKSTAYETKEEKCSNLWSCNSTLLVWHVALLLYSSGIM